MGKAEHQKKSLTQSVSNRSSNIIILQMLKILKKPLTYLDLWGTSLYYLIYIKY